jgi:hypothetical protein
MESDPFEIISLEQEHSISVPVIADAHTFDIRVGGVIDRIDDRQGNIVILDYKTGTVRNSFATLESLFRSGDGQRNDAVFQVLLYAYVYDRLHQGNIIVPGLYFIRASHTGDFTYFIKQGPKKEAIRSFASVREEFETLLSGCLTQMFSVSEPFMQTQNHRICAYCSYAAICRR